MSPRTGRRPGDADTRGDILEAARQLFTEKGFDAVSLRAVARSAEVDPALVHHYFEGKPELFSAAMELQLDLPALVQGVLAEGPVEEVGERLVRTFLQVWGSPAGDRLIALLRSAAVNEDAATMLREFMTSTVLKGVVRQLEVEQAELRAALCAAHIVGVGMLRWILHFGPLVQAEDEELVAWLAPTIQRYLTGPLPTDA